MLGEHVSHRHAEEKVFADRGVRVEALRIEGLDKARFALLRELPANGFTHGDEVLPDLVLGGGADLPQKAQPIDILVEAEQREDVEDALIELGGVLDAGSGKIEPGIARCLERIAAAPRLMLSLRLLLGQGSARELGRRAAQRIDDVVADRAWKQHRFWTRIGHHARQRARAQARDVLAVQADIAFPLRDLVGKRTRHDLASASRRAGKHDMARAIEREGDILDERRAVLIGDRQAVHSDVRGMRRVDRRGELLALLRLIDVELLDDLLVFDRDVVALLIPIDQLLHGRRQVAISGDDGDELADVRAVP